jgi:hypothetical protein
MSKKKPEYLDENVPQLINLCEEYGYEYEKKSRYQYRIYAATHVIDIYPSRMVYHRLQGENIKANEPYPRELNPRFDREQVEELLSTGTYK